MGDETNNPIQRWEDEAALELRDAKARIAALREAAEKVCRAAEERAPSWWNLPLKCGSAELRFAVNGLIAALADSADVECATCKAAGRIHGPDCSSYTADAVSPEPVAHLVRFVGSDHWSLWRTAPCHAEEEPIAEIRSLGVIETIYTVEGK